MSTFIETNGHSPVIDNDGNEINVLKGDKNKYHLLYQNTKQLGYKTVKASEVEIMRARYMVKHGELKEEPKKPKAKAEPQMKVEKSPAKADPKPKAKKYDKEKKIASLNKAVESLTTKIDGISTDYGGLNPTPKRTRQLEANINKRDRLIQYRSILLNLSKAWENDSIPEELKVVNGYSDVEAMRQSSYPRTPEEGDQDWFVEQQEKAIKKRNKLGILNDEDQSRIKEMIEGYMEEKSEADIEKEKFEAKLRELRNSKIPGFFPTPDELCDVLVHNAQLEDGNNILEPSAGIGSIIAAINRKANENHWLDINISSYEINHSLIEILHHREYDTWEADFMDAEVVEQYDRAIMNPPFEKAMDVEHLGKAWQMLLKGGRLVAIVSAGVLSNSVGKYPKFRKWLTGSDQAIIVDEGVQYDFGGTAGIGYLTKLPENSFKSAFRSTGVNTIMIVIDK